MSHLLAARCTHCGQTDDPTCPECGTPASVHGTTDQAPYRIAAAGYVHEWHPACVEQRDCPTPTTEEHR